MSTLAELLARVALALDDADHVRWTTDDLTLHIRHALELINRASPRRMVATVATSAGQREVSLAALGRVLTVVDVWFPWDGSEASYPPRRAPWTLLDGQTLRLEVANPPLGDGADDIRLFYTAPHTISGLDGATLTTLDAYGEEVTALGAAGYASLQASLATADTVNLNPQAPRHWLDWATLRLRQFRQELDALRESAALVGDPRVALVTPGLRGEF